MNKPHQENSNNRIMDLICNKSMGYLKMFLKGRPIISIKIQLTFTLNWMLIKHRSVAVEFPAFH